jgi:peptidoglycan/LPS O-acetylase OafA/YrhL
MSSNIERFHAMDTLRAGALLLGVFAHAAISFFPEPSWVADDVESSPALLVAFFMSHIFRMSLFFAVAGFFAHMLLQKRGVGGFVRNRATRIALPFLVFWPLMLACLVAVALWAARYAGSGPFAGSAAAVTLANAAPAASGGVANFLLHRLPLGHTWFLYILLWLYAGALGLVGVGRLLDRKGLVTGAADALFRALANLHALPFILATPLAAVFLLGTPWTTTSGIRNGDFGLLPGLSTCVGFGTAFGFGWFLHRQTAVLEVWRRRWLVYLNLAAILSWYCAGTMSAAVRDPASLPTDVGATLLRAFAYPLAIWVWCLALIGTATRFLSEERAIVRYLSDSSYWIYLAHLPLVVALQVLVSPWSLPWQAKYPLVVVVAFAILLPSYQLFVRNTLLGAWLNGRRYPPRRSTRAVATTLGARPDDVT